LRRGIRESKVVRKRDRVLEKLKGHRVRSEGESEW